MQPKIVNLVNQHKKMAEGFLRQLIAEKQVPSKFSGVMTPKFGNYVFTWQFNNNKLVGAVLIHLNNVDNYCAKMKVSRDSIDWTSVKVGKDTNEPGESDTIDSDGHTGGA